MGYHTHARTHTALYLSWVEGLHGAPLHEEHVDEVDEDAGREPGLRGRERQPLVDHHEHQVAEQTPHEEQLRQEYQVHVVLLIEVSGGEGGQTIWLSTTLKPPQNTQNPTGLEEITASQVVVDTEHDAEAHVDDSHDHGHLHLIGVQECQPVAGQVPDLWVRTEIKQSKLHRDGTPAGLSHCLPCRFASRYVRNTYECISM